MLALAACGGGGTSSSSTSSSTSSSSGSSSSSSSSGGGSSSGTTPVSGWAAALSSGNASLIDSTTAFTATENLLVEKVASEFAVQQKLLGGIGNGGVDWNPSHDSATFGILDQGRNHVLLTGNWRYKGTDPASGKVLAVAGSDPRSGALYAAFGGNPLAVRGNAAMDVVMVNAIRWLTNRNDLRGLRVVTAHLPGSATTWFLHEAPTHTWLTGQIPAVTINGLAGTTIGDDRCDGDALAACLQNVDLLVIGRQETPNSGVSTYNGPAVMAEIKAAQTRGVPILYLHHDGSTNDLSSRLLDHFGLTVSDNYWSQEGLKGFNASMLTTSPAMRILDVVRRLQSGNFSTTWGDCKNEYGRIVCGQDAALQSEFVNPATTIRSTLRGLDAKGWQLFDQPGHQLEKHLVLLGDALRRDVTYPMDKIADKAAFFRAHFSDMTAYLNRLHSTTARDQGTFSSAIPASASVISRTITTTAPETGTHEFMTGLYVMPGRTVTLRRTDTSSAKVTLGINMLRDTTWLYNSNDYKRPTMLSSPRVPLTADRTATLSSPFGGPLYLFVEATAGAPSIQVQVDGVTTHPVLRDMQDPVQVAGFQSELATTATNWVGLVTDFLVVHSNVPHIRKTLADHGGDIGLLMGRVWTYMVKDTYELAGFNSTSGRFKLSASVSAFCTAAGWDCSGTQHRRADVQHVIVDNHALCGSGCAGNPYDQDWSLNPLGWGETHEIGHNLQRGRLNIYGGRSGEVSNNIFPLHKWMSFNRDNIPTSPKKSNEGSTESAFNVLKAGLQPGATPTYVYDAIWANDAYAANNGLRLSFYRQLVEYARHYNANFSDGWEVFTLLYLLERNFSASENRWNDVRDVLGFSNYTTYPSSITGNDFMLIATSRIVGRDMRPVWNLWGISYSDPASAQVASYGYPASGLLLFPMAYLTTVTSNVGTPVTMTATAIYPESF